MELDTRRKLIIGWMPAGHMASCIQKCKYIWTGGPARRSDQGALGPIL